MRQQIKGGACTPLLLCSLSVNVPLFFPPYVSHLSATLFERLCEAPQRSSTFSLFVSDVPSEQSVFVMLNGEESELRFLNIANPKVSSPLSGSSRSRRTFSKAERRLDNLSSGTGITRLLVFFRFVLAIKVYEVSEERDLAGGITRTIIVIGNVI